MSTDLSHDSESFLFDTVSRGFFPSRIEALEAAVLLLRERQRLVERIAEGRRQLDEGDFVDFDKEGLKKLASQLKERARRSAESR